jgi:hypothetical protein
MLVDRPEGLHEQVGTRTIGNSRRMAVGADGAHSGTQEDLLIEQGQSSNVSDNLEAKSHFLSDKREGQSFKGTLADGAQTRIPTTFCTNNTEI